MKSKLLGKCDFLKDYDWHVSACIQTHLACYGCKVSPHWVICRWGLGTKCSWIASILSISSLRWPTSHRTPHVPRHGTSHGPSWHSLRWHAWHLAPILRQKIERRLVLVCKTLIRVLICFIPQNNYNLLPCVPYTKCCQYATFSNTLRCLFKYSVRT